MRNLRNGIPWLIAFALAYISASSTLSAEQASPLSALGRMPVKELTVFKDGHAFVAREGSLPVDATGNVSLDDLPHPVLGTFWPYSADAQARLTGTVASRRRVRVDRTALTLRELLAANPGADVIITEDANTHYSATIVGIPTRSSEELQGTSPPNAPDQLPMESNLILLKTADGIKAINADRIQDVTFKRGENPTATQEEFRDLMTLKLDWNGRAPAKTAHVGMFYLEKGVRWIPDYKVELNGKGEASIKLQATLINELTDLEDVSMNLVIGVPTFALDNQLDPMGIQQTAAQLSQFFQNDRSRFGNSRFGEFRNSIMSQQVPAAGDYAEASVGAPSSVDLGPDVGDSKKNEDLYVFTVNHITLKKGERMVVPVAEYTLPYRDVYTLDLPFGPPPEMRPNFNNEQERELAALSKSPKFTHKICLNNNGTVPLTTAPALILREGRLLAQGMMTYAAPGAQSDLTITTAVDIQTRKNDVEIKRTPNAAHQNGTDLARIDMNGKLTIINHRLQSVDLQIKRSIFGALDSASDHGTIEKLNLFEDGDDASTGQAFWGGWYNGNIWSTFNGLGRITWKLTLQPAAQMELNYEWHYFWP